MEDPATKIRTIALIAISVSIIIIGTTLTVRDAMSGNMFQNPIYFASVAVTAPFLVLILLGFTRAVPIIFWLTFTAIASYQLLFKEFYEFQVIYLAVLITGSYFFMPERLTYFIVAYCLALYILVFTVKEQPSQFSPDMTAISFFALCLISVYTHLNIRILKRYIKVISKNRESLKAEVKKRTEELEKSKEYAEFLFRKSPVAIYTMDSEGRIVDANEKAEVISGFNRDDVIGRKAESFISSDEDSDQLFNRRNLKSRESILLTGTGEKKIIKRIGSESILSSGREKRFFESFFDVTSYRKLELFKNDVESVLRHDLKTPLNSVIGFSGILLSDDSISEENREYLRIMLDSGRNMLNLINQSLILYKIESGSYELNPEKIEILALLKQIKNELTGIASIKNCTIIINSGNTPDILMSEEILLYMILSNLLKNAVEASPKGEKITIDFEKEERLKITIHNTGAIPVSIRDTFFEKYVTKNKKKGTGLGTYSSKLAASAIGADLTFHTDETRGTDLILSIPLDSSV